MILAILWVIFSENLPISACLFKTITGYPCPGCGGTRAAYALLHGDWLGALLINPLSCLLILFYLLMLVWSIGMDIKGKTLCIDSSQNNGILDYWYLSQLLF